ncbi:TPA: LPXTG cell wall anchor domain-containing protein [Enterococcus faecalis]
MLLPNGYTVYGGLLFLSSIGLLGIKKKKK